MKFDPTGSGFDSRGMKLSNPGDLMYYGVDASVKYSFMNLINSKVIDPSTCWWRYFFGDSSYITKPGAGLAFWFTDKIGFSLETTYKKSFGDREDNGTPDAPSYFHTQVLLSNLEKDTDGDGIYDKDDASRSCWFKRIQRLS
jgi:hypothetical protein